MRMTQTARNGIVGFVGVLAVLVIVFYLTYGPESRVALQVLADRSSMLLTGSQNFSAVVGGFTANILISLCTMVISTVLGAFLVRAMMSGSTSVRRCAIVLMNLMRNSPWLVVLYAMLYLIPFRFKFAGMDVWVSPSVKAILGLSIPVTAYMAEVFRNGIQTVPSAQWESALSLGYTRSEILRRIVLPQAFVQMVPNIMTTYAMLFIGTSLVVVTGTPDVLSIAKVVIASDGNRYATAIYLYILFFFFVFCYPISVASRALEKHLKKAY